MKLSRRLFTLFLLLLPMMLQADERITRQWVMEVIEATDEASRNKDAEGIGKYLGSRFFKYIDLPSEQTPLAVELGRKQYLEHIDRGWKELETYTYNRSDVIINMAQDGLSAQSFSTITEKFTVDGAVMVSKVREYATYEMENGRPVIVQIESHTLVGDTTPK